MLIYGTAPGAVAAVRADAAHRGFGWAYATPHDSTTATIAANTLFRITLHPCWRRLKPAPTSVTVPTNET